MPFFAPTPVVSAVNPAFTPDAVRLILPNRPAIEAAMLALDDQQQAARAGFEEIERAAGSDAAFTYTPWERSDHSGEPGGGGVRGQMTGKVFEKVGVNVSTV